MRKISLSFDGTLRMNLVNKKNDANDLQVLLELSKTKDSIVRVVEKDEVFHRVINFDEEKDLQLIEPTSDWGHFSKIGIKQALYGFFCGDANDWIPILIRDNWLNISLPIAIVKLAFPEGTLCIEEVRNTSLLSDKLIDETFVVHDSPIRPVEFQILTESEIDAFREEAEEDLEMDDNPFFKKEED